MLESSRKAKGIEDRSTPTEEISTQELTKGLKKLWTILINQMSNTMDSTIDKMNTSFNAIFDKEDHEVTQCSKNYNDIKIDREAITSGNKGPYNPNVKATAITPLTKWLFV